MSRGTRRGRRWPPPWGKTASWPFASGRASSAGLQLAIEGREDSETKKDIRESEVRRRVERSNPADERLNREMQAHDDIGIQGLAVIVDEPERDGVRAVFQVQMQRRVIRQVRVVCIVQEHTDMALIRDARGPTGRDEDEVRDAERDRRIGPDEGSLAGEEDRQPRSAARGS